MKLLRPAQDLVFQNIFGRNVSKKVTSHFLSLILEKEIKNITLDKNKRLLSGDIKAKLPRLDLRAEYNDGENSIIEMQTTDYERMHDRMLFYWAIAYKERMEKGEDYNELKPVVSILIANYDIVPFKGIKKYHTVWNLRELDYLSYILTDNIELHVLEIPKIKKLGIDISKDELALWLSFINNPKDKEVLKMVKKGSALDQAMEELKKLSGDPGFNEIVQARAKEIMDDVSFRNAAKRQGIREGLEEGKKEGIEQGKKEGIEQGKKEGIEQGKKEGIEQGKKEGIEQVARKLKNKNIDIKTIKNVTGLTEEEIKNI